MKYYTINKTVGISVDDSYPWVDTLFFHQHLADKNPNTYKECKVFIEVYYQKKLDYSNVRWIGEDAYIGSGVYMDKGYGVRIERPSGECIRLTVSQECNEWIVILLELSLISCGCTMIHGAAVEYDGNVYLMPSWGGVGKTATVCEFVRNQGWKLLGDDLIIIQDGFAFPFLKPFVIYPYHKELFPEVFASAQNHTVKNNTISNLMSKVIPDVKRILRPFPGLLAYLRKHNPQSIRVSPYDLFLPEQLSKGGKPIRTIWLERSCSDKVRLQSSDVSEIVSKTITVTSCELFASKLNNFYQMCGCGLFNYDETINRMYDIIFSTFNNTECFLLEIPMSVDINHIGETIYHQITQNK